MGERVQLAEAAAALLQQDEPHTHSPHLPFAAPSRAQREYQRVVREALAKRRQVREATLAAAAYRARTQIDAAFDEARIETEAALAEALAESAAPFAAREATARAERDAAIAAAHRCYEQVVVEATRAYEREALAAKHDCDSALARQRTERDEAYEAVEKQRKLDALALEDELDLLRIEGLLHVIADRTSRTATERTKAVLALVELAGQADGGMRFTTACLDHVYSAMLEDCYLVASAQGGDSLSSGAVFECLTSLALRCRDKRPAIVKCLHDILAQHRGVRPSTLIGDLAQLYVHISSEAQPLEGHDAEAHAVQRETMLALLDATLQRTPRQQPQAESKRFTPASATTPRLPSLPLPRDCSEDSFSDISITELVDIDASLFSNTRASEPPRLPSLRAAQGWAGSGRQGEPPAHAQTLCAAPDGLLGATSKRS